MCSSCRLGFLSHWAGVLAPSDQMVSTASAQLTSLLCDLHRQARLPGLLLKLLQLQGGMRTGPQHVQAFQKPKDLQLIYWELSVREAQASGTTGVTEMEPSQAAKAKSTGPPGWAVPLPLHPCDQLLEVTGRWATC